MTSIYLHQSFFESIIHLPKSQQSKLSKFIKQFQENPSHPSINLHSVGDSMVDDRVRGAKLDDSYRVIVLPSETGDNYLLLYADKHDLAYNWAKTKRFEFKNRNGYFQISDTHFENLPIPKESLFSKFSDEDLYQAGIEPYDIETIRKIESKEDLISVMKYFDPLVQSVLSFMADGLTVTESLKESIQEEEPIASALSSIIYLTSTELSQTTKVLEVDPKTLENIEIANANQIIKYDKELDWEKIFRESLDKWRIFLHPSQKKIVNRKFSGPLMITGSAGTGKTIVLIHRAVRYLEENRNAKILFLTFSSNLTIEIRNLMKKLLQDRGLTSINTSQLEIASLYRFAESLNKKSGWSGTIVPRSDEKLLRIWDKVTNDLPAGFPLSTEDLINEYFDIKELKGIYDLDSYLTTIRSNRERISREERKQVWAQFEIFESELKKRSLRTAEHAVHEGRIYFEKSKNQKYDHIFVDEVQDMSVEALKFIKSLSGYGDIAEHGITLAGDAHQRVYRTHVMPKNADIQLQGRSAKLRVNYRTSEQIRNFSHSLLLGLNSDGINEEIQKTIGDISTFSGPNPSLYQAGSWDASMAQCKEIVSEWTSQGYKEHEICFVYSDSAGLLTDSPLDLLRKAGLPIFELTAFQEDRDDIAGFRLGTVKRIKGLEFKSVLFIFNPDHSYLKNLNALSIFDRCELYVGTTRARERLAMIDGKDS
jgi:hypothetical protein